MKILVSMVIAAGILLCACNDSSRPVPRRPAYPRIETLPDSFVVIRVGDCAIDINSECLTSAPKAGWLDVTYPTFGATLHLTVTHCLTEEDRCRAIDNRLERMSLNAGESPARELSFTNQDGFECKLLTAQGGRTPLQLLAANQTEVVSGVIAFSGPTTPADSIAPVIQVLDNQMVALLKRLRHAN